MYRFSGYSKVNTFTIAFLLWQCSEIISGSTIKYLSGMNYLRYILLFSAVALLLFIIVKRRYKIKTIVIIGLVSIVFLIADMRTGYGSYLPFWLFLVAIREQDYEKTMLAFYRLLLFAIPFVFCLRYLNIIQDKTDIFMTIDFSRGNFERFALGFYHPNALGMRMFELGALHLYIHRNNLKFRNLIFYIATLAFCYFVPNCMAATICGLFLLVFELYYKYRKELTKRVKNFFKYFFTCLAFLCNVYSLIFGILGIEINQMVNFIDGWTSNRLRYAHLAFSKYGFSWFGTVVNVGRQQGADVKYLDNGYIAVLIKNGFFIYIILSILIIYTIYKATEMDYLLGAILITYAIDGMMTSQLWATSINPFNVIAGVFVLDYVYKRKIKKHIAVKTPSRKLNLDTRYTI